MLILPAIDIYQGKCVRLRQGDYAQQTIYADSPREVAQRFVDAGFSFLHVVDLEGAKQKHIVNWEAIHALASLPGISLEVGGGIRTQEDIEKLLSLGVKRIILGSVAVHAAEFIGKWVAQYGKDRVAVGMDIRNNAVAIHGWQEESALTPETFLQTMSEQGIETIICTDISRDGMLQGPNVELYKHLTTSFPHLSIIASGGVTTIADVEKLALINIAGIIVGKALYEGTMTLKKLATLQNKVK